MLLQFFRYNLVGVVNTLLGFSIVFGLMFLGLSPLVSNAIGYGVGAMFSYILNGKYTFKSTASHGKIIFKFFGVLAVAYSLNILILQTLLPSTNPYLAQLISGVVYTLSSFLMMRFFVFGGR